MMHNPLRSAGFAAAPVAFPQSFPQNLRKPDAPFTPHSGGGCQAPWRTIRGTPRGRSTTVEADGRFSYTAEFPGCGPGEVTAWCFDTHGAQSNLAADIV